MMSKGNRRVWSRVAALSIHQPLSLSSRSLFLLRSSCPPVVCATFALSLSFRRMERAESSVSNSRTSRSLCEYYSPLHSRFFCRIMPYRDAPLHLRVKMSIRFCFLTGTFLHKFSSPRSFVLFCIVLRRLQKSKGETR